MHPIEDEKTPFSSTVGPKIPTEFIGHGSPKTVKLKIVIVKIVK